ncbi:hypothetical protein R0K05_20860, partial [Planococcus sp. SIMBA_160]
MNKFNNCNPFFQNSHFPCAFPEFLGATGATGPTGPTGPLLPVHGVFFTFNVGPFVPSGVITTGTVIPTQL